MKAKIKLIFLAGPVRFLTRGFKAAILFTFCCLISLKLMALPSNEEKSESNLLAESTISSGQVQQNSQNKPPAEQDMNNVEFGLFVTNLYDIDFTDNEFKIEFWSWFRSNSEDYKPRERTEITNAKEFSIRNGTSQKINDIYLHSQVFKGVIKQQWDIRSFPFDTQTLTIRLEDTVDVVQYLDFNVDYSSGLAKDAVPNGWQLVDFSIARDLTSYPTTFGDPRTLVGEPYEFGSVEAKITLKREGSRLFVSSFMGLLVATGLIIVVLSINTSAVARAVIPLQPRITLCVGALFAAVGAIYSMSAKVPYTTSFTLSDSFQITTFLIITLGIVSSVLSDVFAHKDQDDNRKKMMVWCWILFICMHIGINTFMIGSSNL